MYLTISNVMISEIGIIVFINKKVVKNYKIAVSKKLY